MTELIVTTIDETPDFAERLKSGMFSIPANIALNEPEEFISIGEKDMVVVKKMETTAKSCYIAGPMRGYDRCNFLAFDRAKDGLERIGYACISPADLDRANGMDPDAEGFNELIEGMTKADWKLVIARDIEAILSLDPDNGDAVCLLEGWEMSTGAVAEAFFARWCGLVLIDEYGIALDITRVWTSHINESLAVYLQEMV